MATSSILAKIGLNSAGFKTGLAQCRMAAGNFKKSVSGMFSGIGSQILGALGVSAGIAGISALTQKTIEFGGHRVHTVEHIMSALHAFHVDNCIVEMDGMEPPIGDGSSLPYCRMVREAGIVQQEAEARVFTPSKPLYVEGGHTRLVIVPGDVLRIVCTTSFAGCPIDPQFYEFTATDPEAYETEIAGGRTFVDFRDLQQLLAMGLVKGGSLDAAAIIHDGAIICKEGLRYPNEIVRHKILDLFGDIYLTGRRITGSIIAIKPGHPKNVELAGALLKEIAASSQEKNNREMK